MEVSQGLSMCASLQLRNCGAITLRAVRQQELPKFRDDDHEHCEEAHQLIIEERASASSVWRCVSRICLLRFLRFFDSGSERASGPPRILQLPNLLS